MDVGPEKKFRQYLSEGSFHLQRCDQCRQHVFYPRLLCPHCGSMQLTWVPASGRATVYSTSVPRSGGSSYNIALVDLEEGPRMMTRVVDVAPEDVTIGMPVTAFIGTIEPNGEPLVLFRPISGDDS
ncbi:DNA-binding protein [Aestuariicella hydrocarbonica]|uniref:DNA-binding protein n=2 Tax=Pseudomaricurvus hydrocarbonicus TaxID=1470433 RepID=A0A9E5JSS5_9GAMM|nr:DNA-binding protein [Aestuariicella hydrocarbonica]